MNYPYPRHFRLMYIMMITVTVIAILVIISVLTTGSSKVAEEINDDVIDSYELQNSMLQIELQQKNRQLEQAYLRMDQDRQQMEKLVEELEEEKEELISYIDDLSKQAAQLESTIKYILSTGKVKPRNYIIPDPVEKSTYDTYMRNGASVSEPQMEYLGDWTMTVYTASVKECGSDIGLTASGEPVSPGYSIAVDNRYWKFGTKFYVEGIGIVKANDTGGAIKGKNRMDLCIMDVNLAPAFGKKTVKVWLINDEGE